MKNFSLVKDTFKAIKRQTIVWEEIFSKDLSEKDCYLKYKRTLQTQQQEHQKPNSEMEQRP